MKKESSIKWRLGLFVLAGLALFTGAIYTLGKQKNLFGSTFRVHGVFTNVSGLQVGNNVRFSGITVGTVESIIIIRDTSVLVSMNLEGSVKKYIRKDSKAIIGSEGLMGDKLVNIFPGSPNSAGVEDGMTLGTVKPVDFDQILGNLKVTTDNAAVITGDLADIIAHIHDGKGTIGTLLMDSSVAKNIKQTMRSVNKGANGFSQNMEAAQHSFLLKLL